MNSILYFIMLIISVTAMVFTIFIENADLATKLFLINLLCAGYWLAKLIGSIIKNDELD